MDTSSLEVVHNFVPSTDTAFITPSVEIHLLGTKRLLRLTCFAITQVIERDGVRLISDPTTWNEITPQEIAELIYISLAHEQDTRPSIEQILAALDPSNMKVILDAMNKTWNLANTGKAETRPFKLALLQYQQ